MEYLSSSIYLPLFVPFPFFIVNDIRFYCNVILLILMVFHTNLKTTNIFLLNFVRKYEIMKGLKPSDYLTNALFITHFLSVIHRFRLESVLAELNADESLLYLLIFKSIYDLSRF